MGYWALRKVGAEETKDELKEILKKTYVRTASAVFNTSFTTAMAFVVCTSSEVMPMASCSVFAAVCIVVNYLMTITFFPTVLINWHIYFNKKSCKTVCRNCCCCCCRRAKETVQKASASLAPGNVHSNSEELESGSSALPTEDKNVPTN